jgi:REP element-mobilizing transposase RayT
MANTFTQLTIHAVFAVRGRQNLITDDFKESLFTYMGGTLKGLHQYPLLINGHKDHVHLLFELNPTSSISEIIQKVKANSSRWVNEQGFINSKFTWQSGYGAFSNSRSHRKRLLKYIENQENHHAMKSFKQEYIELLNEYNVEFNEKYLFEFYDIKEQ